MKKTYPGPARTREQVEQGVRMSQRSHAPDLEATAQRSRQQIPEVDVIRGYGLLYDGVEPETKTVDQAVTWQMLFNGESFDRRRNNTEIIIASMKRYRDAGIEYTPVVTNHNATGAFFFVYYPSATLATTQIAIGIDAIDPASGLWNTFFLSANLVPTTQPYVLKIKPGITPNFGFAAADPLPRRFRCYIAKTAIGAFYDVSIGANLLL